MSDIALPQRSLGRSPRSGRGVSLPGNPDQVPNVGVARDPGVQVPAGAFQTTPQLDFLGEIADTLQAKIEKQQADLDFVKTSEAFNEYREATSKEWQRRQLEDDPTRPGFAADFEDFTRQQMEQTMQNLPGAVSETARQRFQVRLQEQNTAWSESAGLHHVNSVSKKAVETLNEQVNISATMVEHNPQFLEDFIKDGQDRITDMAGSLTAEQERAARSQLNREMTESAIDGYLAKGGFQEATQLMNQKAAEGVLKPQEQDAIARQISQAVEEEERRRVKADEEAEKKAKEAEKELSDNLLKDGLTLSTNGELTTAWVLERREGLDAADFKTLMKAADKEDEPEDNDVVVADLYLKIADGEDVERDAIIAYSEGKLTRATMNTIVSRNDKSQGQRAPGTPYERAVKYVVTATKPSELNENPAAPELHARSIKAIDAFFDENPNATLSEAMSFAEEIVNGVVLVPNTALSLPFPSWMPGDRNSRTPDLDAAEENLIRDMSNGAIDSSIANHRARVINEWRRILESNGVRK